MTDIAFVPGLVVLMALVSVGYRRSSVFAWALLGGLSLVFFYSMAVRDIEVTLFTWVKVFSLIAGASWINVIRFSTLGSASWARWIMWLVLALNILEASIKDIVEGYYANAAIGLVLIATQAGAGSISISPDRHRDLRWSLGVWWILGYSLWNFGLAYRVFPPTISDHVAALGVPLAWLLVSHRVWFQARGYVLSTYALLIMIWHEAFGLPWPQSVISYSADVYVVIVCGAGVATAAHLSTRLVRRVSKS